MCRLIALVCALVLASGCSAKSDEKQPEGKAPPAPDLAEFLHENYTVISQAKAQLVEGEPEFVVVVSKGPGLTPGVPVPGGTGDVQVLAYDDQAKQWVLAFDAGDQLASIGDAVSARPVLDQSHPIEDVAAQVVHFHGRPAADLVVSGLDNFTNHPSNDVAVIRFGAGTAELAWTSDEVGTPTPVIEGDGAEQSVLVEASYYTEFDAMCCPVRQYTRRLGVDDAGNVVVVDDDRPYLGAYITPLTPATAGAVVLGVEPDSPAVDVLRPGDRVLAIDSEATTEDGKDLELPLLKVLANKTAGQQVTIRLQRDGVVRTVRAELGSLAGAPAPSPAAGQLGVGVYVIEGGFEVVSVGVGSPAELAGLQPGDQLLTVNDWPVTEELDLSVALWHTTGEMIRVTYVDPRGVTHKVEVTPEAASDGPTTGRL